MLGASKVFRAGHPGGSTHFVRGMGLCSVIFLFLVFYPPRVGLGIGLHWLNRVEPSSLNGLHGESCVRRGGGEIFICSFHLYAGRFS